jgi:hypothetical protein
LKPTSSSSGVSAKVDLQGILAATDENLIYPTVGVTTSGRGVMGFSIVSENTFPSVGYTPIDAKAGGRTDRLRRGRQVPAGRSH